MKTTKRPRTRKSLAQKFHDQAKAGTGWWASSDFSQQIRALRCLLRGTGNRIRVTTPGEDPSSVHPHIEVRNAETGWWMSSFNPREVYFAIF